MQGHRGVERNRPARTAGTELGCLVLRRGKPSGAQARASAGSVEAGGFRVGTGAGTRCAALSAWVAPARTVRCASVRSPVLRSVVPAQ
jgi:hypothetical protein